MCGISVSVPTCPDFMRFATEVQHPRGPDETRIVDLGFASLGINRLAISGLVGGSQPLLSADGNIHVVFNGAIYNVADLKQRFGIEVASNNDGEIIAPLYQRFGLQFSDYLEGMFAICIADRRTSQVIVAVDPTGIKPLYMWRGHDKAWRCASDPRAFPEELRREIVRVPPGTVHTSDGRWQRVRREVWRNGKLIELIRSSVREQIPNEVAWGCMLSGGVDSSLIVSLASEVSSPVRTITCGLRGGTDVLAGRRMAEHVKSEHHEVFVEFEELPLLVEAVVRETGSMEPWTVMGGVGTYIVAREARRLGMKVLLSGEGADELFGGYDEFQDLPSVFLKAVLSQYQADLGVTECLRLDRCAMAHGVEARVPFLETSVIRYARSLTPDEMILHSAAGSVRKRALRVAASSVLPSEFADRTKEEFSHGSGISAALRDIAAARYPDNVVQELSFAHPSFGITSSVHAWFFDEWIRRFGASFGGQWPSLVHRGLFRQTVSHYLPQGRDPIDYLGSETPRSQVT